MNSPDSQAHASLTASVLICCHDEGRFAALGEAIGSVLDQLAPGDDLLVVVDHNPTLLARIAEAFPTVSVVANREFRGLSGARNTGVAASGGELVVFLDDDAVAGPGMLPAIKALANRDAVIGVAGHVDPDWLSGRPAWFPAEMLWTVGCTYKGMRPGPVRNAIGALMAIKRSVLDAAGLFRTELGRGASRLPLGCEETELCIRAGRRFPGHVFVYTPEVFCTHKVPASRATWRYLLTRCWAEGLSKACLADRSIRQAGLSTERDYVLKTLPAAVATGVFDMCKGDVAGLGRAWAVTLGFLATALAFAWGRCRRVPTFGRLLDRHSSSGALLGNAGALAAGTLASAVLGFVYWWVAARGFSPRAVGLASAAIAMMNLLAHVGELGLGPLLLGYLPRFQTQAFTMLSTALLGVVLSCLAVSLLYAGGTAAFGFGIDGLTDRPFTAALFVLGVVTTGLTLVIDQAMVGLLRSAAQMWRNILFAAAKLALLVGLALTAGRADATWIFATWIAGQVLSFAVVARRLGDGERLLHRPRLALLRPIVGDVLAHHALNVALQAPALALPFVVAVVLSPETNAAFFAAWALVNVALLVPASLTTVLYTTGSGEPRLMAPRLRLSLALSGALGLVSGLGLLFFSPFVLGLFSPAYPALAGTGLKVLGFGVLGVAVKYHYVALKRFSGEMASAAALCTAGCTLELAATVVGGRLGGLTGLTQGWVAGVLVEAVVMAPLVIAAARADADPPAVTPPQAELEPA